MKGTKQALAFLKAARNAATFEKASFGSLSSPATITLTESEVTDFIRERTRIYRQSWILPYLDELEKILKGEKVTWTPSDY